MQHCLLAARMPQILYRKHHVVPAHQHIPGMRTGGQVFPGGCQASGLLQGNEPTTQLRNPGIILGEDHERMSKARNNVVAPDDVVGRYGADAV
jgi:hypothetical protein